MNKIQCHEGPFYFRELIISEIWRQFCFLCNHKQACSWSLTLLTRAEDLAFSTAFLRKTGRYLHSFSPLPSFPPNVITVCCSEALRSSYSPALLTALLILSRSRGDEVIFLLARRSGRAEPLFTHVFSLTVIG